MCGNDDDGGQRKIKNEKCFFLVSFRNKIFSVGRRICRVFIVVVVELMWRQLVILSCGQIFKSHQINLAGFPMSGTKPLHTGKCGSELIDETTLFRYGGSLQLIFHIINFGAERRGRNGCILILNEIVCYDGNIQHGLFA